MNNEMMKSVLMIAVFFAIIYFLMIRPQKKREKAVRTMRDTLQVGDEIITIGGFIGKIVSVKGDTLVISVGADKNKLEIMKWGVSKLAKDEFDPAIPKSNRFKRASAAVKPASRGDEAEKTPDADSKTDNVKSSRVKKLN